MNSNYLSVDSVIWLFFARQVKDWFELLSERYIPSVKPIIKAMAFDRNQLIISIDRVH